MMKGQKMCPVHMVAWVLLLIGGLNLGLVGAFGWDFVNAILGTWPVVERIFFVLVGVSAIAMLFKHSCKACVTEGKGSMPEKKMGDNEGGGSSMGGEQGSSHESGSSM